MPSSPKYTFKDGPYKRRTVKASISWKACSESSLHAFVSKLTDNGYGITFSRTQDGGGLSLTVLAGQDRIKEYMTDTSDILPTLNSILEWADL